MAGGVINNPRIDSSGDIHEFCQNLRKLCMKNGVVVKTNTEGISHIYLDRNVNF